MVEGKFIRKIGQKQTISHLFAPVYVPSRQMTGDVGENLRQKRNFDQSISELE